MRVKVISSDERVNIWIPSGLIFNALVARVGAWALKKEHEKNPDTPVLSYRHISNLFRVIRRAKRIHRGWTLVEICTAEGEDIVVKL